MSSPSTIPALDLDLFTDEVLDDPYPAYSQLRDVGPAVYLNAHSVWALGRYADVKNALADVATFSSARGVALTEQMSVQTAGTVLGSDPPQHDVLRAVLSERLAPRALRTLRSWITERADDLVSAVVSRSSGFDAISDLCARLPVDVVADLIGLPQQGRETILPGADAIFTTFGPLDARLQNKFPLMEAYQQFINNSLDRETLAEGGWGASVLDAVDAGRIRAEDAGPLMTAYMVAGMDTTVNSLGAFVELLGHRPDLWAALKDDPSRVAGAYEEILRLESPVQAFFRVTTHDVEMGEATIPAGSRVMMCYGSANRDERHYPDPDRFDLDRNPVDHVAFGYGTHGCAGQGLARIEAPALIRALLRHVDRLEPRGPAVRRLNPVVRGLASLPMTATPATAT